MIIKSVIGAVLAASLILTGCQDSEGASAGAGYPSGPMTMTAGANPGSGFEVTIRSVVEALQKEPIVEVPLPVQKRPGASGADFLATMVEQYKGKDDQVSVTSLSMMMNELRGKSKYGSPTWKQIAERSQFTTTFMIGDEFPTFLAKTQADLKAALKEAGP